MPECATEGCSRVHQAHDNFCPGCGTLLNESAQEEAADG